LYLDLSQNTINYPYTSLILVLQPTIDRRYSALSTRWDLPLVNSGTRRSYLRIPMLLLHITITGQEVSVDVDEKASRDEAKRGNEGKVINNPSRSHAPQDAVRVRVSRRSDPTLDLLTASTSAVQPQTYPAHPFLFFSFLFFFPFPTLSLLSLRFGFPC